jgi:hypothetical protein
MSSRTGRHGDLPYLAGVTCFDVAPSVVIGWNKDDLTDEEFWDPVTVRRYP